MAERLRIVVEFSRNKEKDLLLYKKLLEHSNPGATIKDILFGVTPLPKLTNKK